VVEGAVGGEESGRCEEGYLLEGIIEGRGGDGGVEAGKGGTQAGREEHF